MPNYANVDALNKYYSAMQEPIKANMKQAENDYNYNLEKLKTDKEGQDAMAYRALQRQLKTVPEEMSAAGAQGGMVDSGIAYIKNRYLQGRNDRDVQLAADNAALGRDYQNALEGYRGQLAKYEQQAAADRAELEYQQAMAAARAASGGGGRRSSRRSGSGNYDNTSVAPIVEDQGDSFSSNYGNYKVLPTTAQMMLSSTTDALRNGGNKPAAINNGGSFASNYGNYKTIGSSSIALPAATNNQKKSTSNLYSLKR